jgi:hypothetical protein
MGGFTIGWAVGHKPRIGPVTRSFFESLDPFRLGGHDGGSRQSTGRDTRFENTFGRHRPSCLTSVSQQGSISHHGKGLRVPDQPNEPEVNPWSSATIGVGAPFSVSAGAAPGVRAADSAWSI